MCKNLTGLGGEVWKLCTIIACRGVYEQQHLDCGWLWKRPRHAPKTTVGSLLKSKTGFMTPFKKIHFSALKSLLFLNFPPHCFYTKYGSCWVALESHSFWGILAKDSLNSHQTLVYCWPGWAHSSRWWCAAQPLTATPPLKIAENVLCLASNKVKRSCFIFQSLMKLFGL
jgi:hypothetical protein